MENNLPQGWIIETLEEICYINMGQSPPSSSYNNNGKGLPFYQGKTEFGEIFPTPRKYCSEPIKIAEENDVLISVRAPVGPTNLCFEKSCIGRGLASIRAINFSYKYLFYYLRKVEKKIASQGTGSTFKAISKKIIESIEIPLPPLAEQNRIIKKLDAAFDKLKKAEEALADVPEMVKDFKQSILFHGMNGELTKDWRTGNENVTNVLVFLTELKEKRKIEYDKAVPKAKELGLKKPKKDFEFTFAKHPKIENWSVAKLDQLIYISARIGWKGLKAEEYTKSGPLFLSVHSLNYGEEVEFSAAYHISRKRYEESPEIMLRNDDILLCKDGAGIGKIGIVKNLNEEATINSSLLLIRALEAFDSKFLFYFFSGPTLQEVVRSRITGSAIPHLFQRDIKEFNLSVPPLEEQKEIVKKIEEMMSVVQNLENVYRSSILEIKQIRNSLLSKAFRGELVEQDPNDEPVNVLLEKIQQEKQRLEAELKAKRKQRRSQPKKKRVMKNLEIIEVLKISGQPMKADEVWRESKYREDIDAFYEQLRHEVEVAKNVQSVVETDQETYLNLIENGN